MHKATIVAALFAIVALSGCSLFRGGEEAQPSTMRFNNVGIPDELSTVKTKELVYPENLGELQPPRNDGVNLADYNPKNDVIEAIGGNNSERNTSNRSDRILIAYASRMGNDPQIRQTLQSEDLAFRRNTKIGFLERVFNVSRYFRIYEKMNLNQYAELKRLRDANVRTPPAPPQGAN